MNSEERAQGADEMITRVREENCSYPDREDLIENCPDDPFAFTRIKGELKAFVHARIVWTGFPDYTLDENGAPDQPIIDWDPEHIETIVVRPVMKCWGRGLTK